MYKVEDFKFIGAFEAGERKWYGVIKHVGHGTAYAPIGGSWVELDSTTGNNIRTIRPGDDLCDFLNENRPAITDAATVQPELRAEDFEYIGEVADPDNQHAPWPNCYKHKPTGRRFAQLTTEPRELDESGRGTIIEDAALLGILAQVNDLKLHRTKPVPEPVIATADISEFRRIPKVADPNSIEKPWRSCVEHIPSGRRYACCRSFPTALNSDGSDGGDVTDESLKQTLKRCMNELPEPGSDPEPKPGPETVAEPEPTPEPDPAQPDRAAILWNLRNELRSAITTRDQELRRSIALFVEAGATPVQQLAMRDALDEVWNIIERVMTEAQNEA